MVSLEELGKWLADCGEAINEEQANFCDTSLWDWQFDEPLPLNQLPSNHFIPSNDDLFLGLSVPDETEAPFNVPHNEKDEQKKEERAITFEEVSRYFDVPISVAAKELNTGLTQLKKKCRELGIPRWPHRRIKSLHALIINVQELGREEGETGEEQLRRAIEILERERETLEREPGTQLEEKTKRLRQACFKASFKKRRMKNRAACAKVAGRASSSSTDAISALPSGTGTCSGNGWARRT